MTYGTDGALKGDIPDTTLLVFRLPCNVFAPRAMYGTSASELSKINAFFAKHVDELINVHGEEQRVMEDLLSSRWCESLELNCFTFATFESFREAIHSCPHKNFFMAYFSGHFSEDQI
jgi:hypothetical protein